MSLWPNDRRDLLGHCPTGHVGLANVATETIGRSTRQIAYFGNPDIEETSSVPEGAFQGSACILAPLVGGGMSSADSSATIALSGQANLLSGGPMQGAASVTWSAAGNAALIVGMSGEATVSVAGNASLLSLTIGLDGAATFAFNGNASNLGLIVPFAGAAAINLSGAADLRGLLSLSGASTPYTELSPENLALAVWGRIVEAGFTAEQVLRIVAAHAAGAATGLESGNPQFTGLDGSTLRIDGTYSAGTRTIDALDGS